MKKKHSIIALGLAMFSMFFGAGNVIFPILVGQTTQSQAIYAICGLLITAVCLPFMGLMSVSLYNGDYIKYFSRMGKIPGWIVTLSIMGILGPFGGIPRCIAISHANIQTFIPQLDPYTFGIFSVIVIYFCTYKRRRIIDILGKVLTPFLLLALFFIIYKGLSGDFISMRGSYTPISAFSFGLVEGYNTMDIFAAFMFASIIVSSLTHEEPEIIHNKPKLLSIQMKASLIGASFLAAIYVGLALVASRFSTNLENAQLDRILSVMSTEIIGSHAGIIVGTAVALACLTTAISLSMVFSEFISQKVVSINYKTALFITLSISFLVSTLQFTAIQSFLVPILQVGLPCMIVFALLSLFDRLKGVSQMMRPAVLITLALSLAHYMYY